MLSCAVKHITLGHSPAEHDAVEEVFVMQGKLVDAQHVLFC